VAGSLEINQRSAVAGGPKTVFFKTSEKNFAPWLSLLSFGAFFRRILNIKAPPDLGGVFW
jgi:hypothetical protein